MILRAEALRYPATAETGVTLLGSNTWVQPEKAILANCAAVREWDCNGTNFGYDATHQQTAASLVTTTFYAVVVAAAQHQHWNGQQLFAWHVVIR